MAEFRGEIEGHPVAVQFRGDGRPVFTAEELAGSRFETYEKLESAIKAHDLETRKDFVNKEAVYAAYGDVGVVEVTSISADGKEAWIKRNGKREKVRRERLFESKTEVVEIRAKEAELKRQIAEYWEKAKRWEPRQGKA